MPPQPHPDAFLPLRPLELLVLLMVSVEPLHGYGIRQAILDHAGGRIQVEAANLYRHIRRLNAEGLIESSAIRESRDAPPRRLFRATPLGRRVLAAELHRLTAMIDFANDQNLLGRNA